MWDGFGIAVKTLCIPLLLIRVWVGAVE